jgi:hypothetical protein
MQPRLTMNQKAAEAFFTRLTTAGRTAQRVAIQRLAVSGEAHALRAINELIYWKEERGYQRTGDLRASIHAFAVEQGKVWKVYLVATAPYAAFNERGTFGSRGPWTGRVSVQDILQMAANAPGELIVLEFGSVEKGLEPRPFILPSWELMRREMPRTVYEALLEAWK